MSDISFEGKLYKDIDLDAQRVLQAQKIHTFRYYPQEKVWMASNLCAEYFGINKFYKVKSYDDGPGIVCDSDVEKDHKLYETIMKDGVDTVSEQLRLKKGNVMHRVTLTVLEKDENNDPTIIAGLIEDYDDRMKREWLMQILADDYQSVYFVDFDRNEVTSYRLQKFIEDNYGKAISSKPKYDDIISKYIDNEVIAEEREEMHMVTSYENLSSYFTNKKILMHDFRVMRDGKPLFIRMKAVNVSDGRKLTNMVIGFADVSQSRFQEHDRTHYYDQVTLGYNYAYYSERLKTEVNPGFIVSMDIRSFKMVNDACGITKGDKTLQYVSRVIECNVGKKGFFGHVNADHFVFYLNVDSEEAVIEILDQIIEDFKNIVKELEIPKVAPYFGVTRWEPGDRNQVMFSEANMAKHRIKNQKDVSYGFYRDEDNAAAIEEKRIEDSFDTAISEQQFVIWYQPKYNPKDNSLWGAEALIRWIKPDGSMVFPNQFIPIYERNGMIRQLDEYVFTRVCEQIKEWEKKYNRLVPVSINLSRASLFYQNIVEEYRDIADRIGVDTSLVPIEITESAAISNSDIKSIADRFFEAGFPLHIDDFGTGYSSLSTLNLMKFDTLKLDKSLIDFIGEFGGDRLIKHTVALAKDLGLHVTAEGVETDKQVEFLRSVDCDSIQGYFYAKPMPYDQFEERLA